MAGIGEVAIRIAHHPLGTVIVVLDGDVDRHVRRLPHVLSVRRCPRYGNGRRSLPAPPGRLLLIRGYASATASSPASNRISGTSVRLIPSLSSVSTISMPNAFGPAATGTAAKDLYV